MSPEDYWHENYRVAYAKADKLRKEERNREMWLQGLYIYHAVSCAINNAFSKKKISYMDEPLRIFPLTEEEKKAEEEKKRKRIEERLTSFAKSFNGRQQHHS